MRVLLSSIPQHGHLLPLLPLARALRAQGAEVAFLTSAGIGPVLTAENIPLLAAGPMPDVLGEEALRRTGDNPFVHPTPAAAAAFLSTPGSTSAARTRWPRAARSNPTW